MQTEEVQETLQEELQTAPDKEVLTAYKGFVEAIHNSVKDSVDPSTIGIVFDCDGVLIDSVDVWMDLEASLGRRAGIEVTEKDTEILLTLTIPEVGDYFHNTYGLGNSPEEVVAMIDEHMMDFYGNRSHACEGASELVESLAELGVHMSVASSSRSPYILTGLKHVGLARYMDAIMSVDDVQASKREPKVFEACREAMGTSLENTWGVEDSLYAVRTLHNAGFKVLTVFGHDMGGTREEFAALSNKVVSSLSEVSPSLFLQQD